MFKALQNRWKETINTNELLNIDKRHIWHPFTPMQDWIANKQIVIEKGEGNYLIDTEGKKYLDGVSSLWVNVHGHNHPYLNKAIKNQLSKISHSTFLGLTNVPAIELSDKLIKLLPPKLTRIFYSDNGSTAVEVALKIAYQYWQQHPQNFSQKKDFISFSTAYHGDTIGAVSLGGIDLFHKVYESLLFKTVQTIYPYPLKEQKNREQSEQESIKKLKATLEAKHETIAGIIVEPLVQGASGMLTTSVWFLQQVQKLAKAYQVLLIVDEVATGFGRTGAMFAVEKADVFPDIICLAKGLTGGYLPLAATVTTENIFNKFLGKVSEGKTFYHGHTYTGNPLAAAVAVANLELFTKDRVLEKLQEKIFYLIKGLKKIEGLPQVAEVRQIGMMVGIELAKSKKPYVPYDPKLRIGHNVTLVARERGIILRPLGDVIVLMPPLSITIKQLNTIIEVIKDSINQVTKKI